MGNTITRSRRSALRWAAALATYLFAAVCVSSVLSAQTPTVIGNDVLRLSFEIRDDGIHWTGLRDVATDREMLAGGEPFWRLAVEDAKGKKYNLDNLAGWKRVSISPPPKANSTFNSQNAKVELLWRGSKDLGADALEVRCDISLEGSRTTWNLSVENKTSYSLRTISFPYVVTRPLGGDGSDDEVVFPRGPGERHVDPFAKPVSYAGDYPTGWGSYQFFTHYDRAGGLYVATHDPVGSTKRLEVGTRKKNTQFLMQFDWPAENATIPGNGFTMPGPAVIQLFRGDWFDAALIYRDWARKNARWWPREPLRPDTPAWMHETALWAMTGGTSQAVVGPVREFAAYMGVPTALHWYNWHQIPFDTDYPHYFPAKPGFAAGVKELQAAGVRVMPYINGRLWDTGLEDFGKAARPFACKNERGEPYIEEYGSKRKLAPMCPTTKFWQDKVNEIVMRLVGPECGVDGVYIDQVAAAKPCLCFDRSHGHPLAGGHWWTTLGYWPMLERLRADMRKPYPHSMITTECNAEPYIQVFDGYLTWHWQHNGQVPVWPAIYGGQVQMFGRAYRGGPTKDLALRMKAAQQLVYGEQLGWLGPEVIHEKDNAAFLRRMAKLRHVLRDYLADGEMMRPPKPVGTIPNVAADWQWSGVWPVTDRAIQAGAWRANNGRLALIFVNVTTGTLSFELNFNGKDYGLTGNQLRLAARTETGPGETVTLPLTFRRSVRLEPMDAVVFELAGGKGQRSEAQ